jgi:hypothetical protein
LICTIALAGVFMLTVSAVKASADAKYPDWRGAWERWAPPNATRDTGDSGAGFTAGGQPSFDQTKPWGIGQQAPLIPEYQKVLEDSIADQAKGSQGNHFDHGVRCMPAGMPLMTIAFYPLEFGEHDHYRRIFTDGRDWPESGEPTYAGYSIGRWSGRIEARIGLRMMPTFPRSPLSFRTASFPQYGWKAGFPSGAFLGDQRLKPAPGIRRPPSSLHPPFVHLVVATVVRSESGLRTRSCTAMRWITPLTPGALARVRVVVSRSVIT